MEKTLQELILEHDPESTGVATIVEPTPTTGEQNASSESTNNS